MARSWQTVRVFISSTFRDMHAERDFLVKNVFPDLREWCERWKLHLVDIDLRWGVTAAEAESGKVIDIVLEQIDGSRPFFICMLGNRYGHVPKPGDVPQTTRERYDRLKDKEDYSITHLEIHHAILEPLKSLDAQEQTPHAFFYFRDEHSLPRPEDVQGLDDKGRTLYQEVFFEKDPDRVARLNDLKGEIKRHYERLGKERNNSNEIFERIFTYKPEFDPNIPNPEDDEFKKGRLTRESLKIFGERVKEDLEKAISQQFKDRIAALLEKVEEDVLETERNYHESFVEHRIRSFIGRTGHLKELTDYEEGDSTHILAVYGDAGSGKSALLAKFYRDYKYDKDGSEINKDILFIPHFVGASPGSSALHNLLRRLCEELFNHSLKNEMEQRLAGVTGVGEDAQKERDAIRKEYEISSDINKLPETFRSFLAKVKGKTVILIDGLNQLDETERAHDLNWLPNELPKNVKIIASTLEGDTKEALERKTDKRVVITPLTDEERLEIIREMPSVFCKTLDDEHIKALLEKKETANPLYLKVTLEELRIYGGFGKKGERLKELIQKFPTDVVDMFVYILDRLERDVREGAKERDKSWIVERFFCLLECSRYGLTSGELRELMADDAENLYHGILRQIRDYLLNRGELIDFFHRELSKAIRKKYLRDGDTSRWHRILAEYFQSKPLYLESKDKKVPNTRKLIEQPWQQMKQGNMWDELEKTLVDLRFIEANCRVGRSHDLESDYQKTLRSWPGHSHYDPFDRPRAEPVPQWLRECTESVVVSRLFSNLTNGSGPVLSQILANPRDTSTAISVPAVFPPELYSKLPDGWPTLDNRIRDKLLRSVAALRPAFGPSQPLPDAACDFGLEAQVERASRQQAVSSQPIVRELTAAKVEAFATFLASRVNWLDSFPQETIPTAWNYRASGPIPECAESLLGGYQMTWIERLGRPQQECVPPVLIRMFPRDGLSDVAMAIDGRIAVSNSSNRAICVWDLPSGLKRFEFAEHLGASNCVKITGDGKYAISGGTDGAVCIWDLRAGRLLRALLGHANPVIAVAISFDGRVAISGSRDNIFMVWDCSTGECVRRWNAPLESGESICSIKITADGRIGFSSSVPQREGTIVDDRVFLNPVSTLLLVWDIGTGRLLRTLPQSSGVFAISQNGRICLCADDTLLNLWDVGQGICLRILYGHESEITALSLTPDGRTAVSASHDRTLRVWDIVTGNALRVIPDCPHVPSSMAVTQDGALAITAGNSRLVVWDLSHGKTSPRLTSHSGPVNLLNVSPNGKEVVSAVTGRGHGETVDYDLRSWDTASGTDLRRFSGHRRAIYTFGFTKDGTSVVSGAGDNDLRVWSLRGCHSDSRLVGHEDRVYCLALLPDGKTVVSGSKDKTLIVWDLPAGRAILRLKGHELAVNVVKTSPDGRFVVSSSFGSSSQVEAPAAHVWDLATGLGVCEFREHGKEIRALAISPNGMTALSAGADKVFRIWNIRSGETLRIMEHSYSHIDSVEMTPDGRKAVYTAEYGDKVGILELCPDQISEPLRELESVAPPFTLSADGKNLVCTGPHRSLQAVHVIQIATGLVIARHFVNQRVSGISPMHPTGVFAIGTTYGEVQILRIRSLRMGNPIATLTRVFHVGSGQYEGQLSVVCPWCGDHFAPQLAVLDAIISILSDNRISSVRPSSVNLPSAVFDDPRLMVQCLKCRRSLRLNPFVVDNSSDWS